MGKFNVHLQKGLKNLLLVQERYRVLRTYEDHSFGTAFMPNIDVLGDVVKTEMYEYTEYSVMNTLTGKLLDGVKCLVDEEETIYWVKDGLLGRDTDHPSVILKSGGIYWYKGGLLHREVGPASIALGDAEWYENGIEIIKN